MLLPNRTYGIKLPFIAWAVLLTSACCARSASAQQAGSSPQIMLEFLAKAAPAGSLMSLPSTYPAHFSDWTDAQKKSGFLQVAQRCSLLNAMEHDNPSARMLPTSMTPREEAELAVSVCLPARMPADWPDRRKYLTDAQGLIIKANANGSTLHLPANLKDN